MKRNPSSPIINAARCQHRTPTGRQCCSLAQAGSALCLRHAAMPQHYAPADFAATLLRDARRFQSAQGVNHSLRELYTLLAEDRISPRRASVLAYISSLLLRTLPAIDSDPYPHAGMVPPPPINPAHALNEEKEDNEEAEGDEEEEGSEEEADTDEEAEDATEPLETNKDPLQPDSDDALKKSKPN